MKPKKKARSGRQPTILDPAARPYKALIQGDYKSGKTTLACSAIHWVKEQGFTPEQVRILYLDNDDGFEPLLPKNIMPKEYTEAPTLLHYLNMDYDDLRNATMMHLGELVDHKKDHGPETAWIFVDNMLMAYDWSQEKMSMDVYGMDQHQLALEMRAQAQESDKGRKMAPTFDRRNEYGIIKGIHNKWLQPIILSGVNFILLTPEKDEWVDNATTGKKIPACQPQVPGMVDHIFRTHKKDKVYYTDLLESRISDKFPVRFKGLTHSKFKKFLDLQRDDSAEEDS